MEVDATIQEEFVEEEVDYISAIKLAVSEDDEEGGGDAEEVSGGSQMDTTTTKTSNRENGGLGDMASGSKQKPNYNINDVSGEELLGFEEDTLKPKYAEIVASPMDVVEDSSDTKVESESECDVVPPPKKSRLSEDSADTLVELKASLSPPTSGVSPTHPPVTTPVVPAALKLKTPKDEFYKKPFEFGWKRELVYRANPEVSKDKADVYFISPSGKKLRSKNEITPLLDGDLTIEHFCFAKEPQGLSADLETVRSAKPTHRAAAEIINISSSTSSGKRVSKPKAPKGASPPPQGWTPTRALKSSSSLNTNSNSNSSATSGNTAASPKNTPKSSKSRKTNNNNNTEAVAENDVVTNDRSKRNHSSNSHRKTPTAASANAIQTTATAAVQSSPPGNSTNQAQQTTRLSESASLTFASNFFANVSVGYGAILHILKYLKIHERPRAASVCKIWNLVAKDRSLWQTVRMKNSKVSNWAGFTAALRRGETKHLDLRKLLVSSNKLEDTWTNFCRYIGGVTTLEQIDLCRCSTLVVESLFVTNTNLTILNALAINDETINLENVGNLVKLEELRLRTLEKCTLTGDLSPLRALKNLRHLTLSSVKQLGTKAIEVIGELESLVSLELGECNDFDSRFTDSVLPKLTNLKRLRLEIGQEQCRTLDILDSVAKLEKLSHLEFVNFDIKPGFDDKLFQCTNIRKLLIIPTYISQSATTNNIVLNAVLKLKDTLQVFTWGVTVELLRVTALYVDQCEDSTRKERRHFDECIPVLKPVPGSAAAESSGDEPSTGANAVPQIEILPLDKVEEILHDHLSTTKFTIVKVPYHATWKQQLVE